MWAVLCVAAGFSLSPQPNPNPGPRWEYRAVETSGPPFGSAESERRWVDGLSQLGAAGWELVAIGNRWPSTINSQRADLQPGYFYYRRSVRADTRTRWEYKLIDLGDLLRETLGQSDPTVETKSLDRLGREGAEGWELAAVLQENESSGGKTFGVARRFFFLKRTVR
jgi:hypothetical protein